MAEPRLVLIVNHQAEIAARTAQHINAIPGMSAKIIRPQDTQELRAFLQTQRPILVLVHRTADGVGALPLLQDAVAGLKLDPKIPTYVISAGEMKAPMERTLGPWRKALGRTLEVRHMMSGPLKPSELRALINEVSPTQPVVFPEPAAQTSDEILLHAIPLPARIVRNESPDALLNSRWDWQPNHPPPTCADGWEFRTLRRDRKGVPQSHQLRSQALLDGRVLQIAVPMEAGPEDTVLSHLQDLWDILERIEFKRLRYYRRISVPGSRGYVCLEHFFGDPAPNLAAAGEWSEAWVRESEYGDQVCAPLDGFLAERFDRYPSGQNFRTLHFEVNDQSIEANVPGDPGVSFWNKIASLGPEHQWVEIPILCKPIHPGEKREVARAVIVADRHGLATEITNEEIRRRQETILRIRNSLARVINQEIQSDHRRRQEAAQQTFLDAVPSTTGAKAFNDYANQIVARARELGECQFAMLCWRLGHTDATLVKAAEIDGQFGQLRKPTRELVNQALTPGEFEVLDEALRTETAQYDPDGLRPFGKSLAPDIQPSSAALPIKVGNTLVGVLALADIRKRRLTRRRLQGVVELLNSCAVVIDYLAAAELRSIWESAHFHDVRTHSTFATELIKELTEADPVNIDLKRAYRSVLLLQDLGRGYNENGERLVRPQRFNPSEVLAVQFELARIAGDDERPPKCLTLSGAARSCVVRGDEQALGHAVRTFLQNAMRHGQGGNIQVTETATSKHWRLEVTNAGHMNVEAYALRFTPYRYPGLRAVGSHTALWTAIRWCTPYRAKLSLENSCSEQGLCDCKEAEQFVVATLTWPVAQVLR
jgi:hypothetical protein